MQRIRIVKCNTRYPFFFAGTPIFDLYPQFDKGRGIIRILENVKIGLQVQQSTFKTSKHNKGPYRKDICIPRKKDWR
ncbi:hypothetical protein D5086_004377 [Populus alba]|uniref:Uncharacterized protein n=1 Tax=Populus alba TaxID=43335 RepID=A0ACC4CRM4_POPAL